MSKLIIPQGYKSKLSLYETQTAIGKMKRLFEDNLSRALNLSRVSAPLFVEPHTGLNDDLSGTERPVEFEVKEMGGCVHIVHSLAKWKRMALHRYKFPVGQGIYTDMNAIRRDDEMDNTHSIYVDQWDWEKIIKPSQRNINYLQDVVRIIARAIFDTAERLHAIHPELRAEIKRDVTFVTSQELEDMYPEMASGQRETASAKKNKTICVMQIGDKLKSGKTHGNRAPDYDDWNLNCDIIYWHETLNTAMEISSMGIRVDAETLDKQLTLSGCDNRRSLTYHKELLAGNLPFTIGGGIGQSRLSMLLLEKAHIGEVQVSVWDRETHEKCAANGVELL